MDASTLTAIAAFVTALGGVIATLWFGARKSKVDLGDSIQRRVDDVLRWQDGRIKQQEERIVMQEERIVVLERHLKECEETLSILRAAAI